MKREANPKVFIRRYNKKQKRRVIKKKSKPVQLPLRQRKKDNRAGRQEGK